MAKKAHNFLAIDLGASNGRVIRGRLLGGTLELQVVRRFEHHPVRSRGRLVWDWPRILGGIRKGLVAAAEACSREPIASVSCSSWAQDFGLLDASGKLFYPPVSYRDGRTAGMPESFGHLIAPNDLVARVGSGRTPVTALCQLRAMAAAEPAALERAATLLFVADLVHHSLCGATSSDWTMATASQLRNLRTGKWDADLLADLGIPSHFLPNTTTGAAIIGRIPADNGISRKLAGVAVVSTAGHDTAVGAACAAPLRKGTFFLSLGTWAMLGCCTGRLLVPRDPADRNCVILGIARQKWAVFKGGTGLWLLQECQRLWRQRGLSLGHAQLVAEARRAKTRGTIDPAEPRFHAPQDMLAEIARACRQAGGDVPRTPGQFARVIFESLAAHYAGALQDLQRTLGIEARSLHVLGGGSRNSYLCERLGELSGFPIQAGPAEAAACGNVLLQAESLGLVADENESRQVLADSISADMHQP